MTRSLKPSPTLSSWSETLPWNQVRQLSDWRGVHLSFFLSSFLLLRSFRFFFQNEHVDEGARNSCTHVANAHALLHRERGIIGSAASLLSTYGHSLSVESVLQGKNSRDDSIFRVLVWQELWCCRWERLNRKFIISSFTINSTRCSTLLDCIFEATNRKCE